MIGIVAPVVALEIPVEIKVKGLSTICFHPGGQGTDAARAVKEMGEESLLVAFNGGESGTVLRAMLDAYQINHQLVPVAAPTNTVLKLTSEYREQQVFQLAALRVSRHESDDLYSAASLMTMDCSVVVLSGVTVEGMPDDFFPCLIRHANSHNVKTVVDLEPELMLSTLDAHPTVIKPNVDQLRSIFNLGENTPIKELVGVAKELLRRGARNVVISSGAGGAVALGDGFALQLTPPRVEASVERGAGDCMVAAVAVGLARDMPLEEAVKMGVAAGCAKVLRHGLGTCRRDVIQRLLDRVTVQTIR
ncbi:MAG: bifunctional hydroxymethylpyrimidine kinase/phosphomethylpyrimidine kinase [Chloroflexi bacterium]|nr:bifunctional hydroxymethylpyrimidine kinase/phosphomethylpyrimidine kinase [Chloroflexota bacterium]